MMIKTDEEALICDLAETYRIYDYRQLPADKVAVFSVGLRENSRIKLKLSNQSVSVDLLVQAGILDSLRFLAWAKTEDGQKGRNRPESIVGMLTGQEKVKEELGFESGEEFELARNELLRKIRMKGDG